MSNLQNKVFGGLVVAGVIALGAGAAQAGETSVYNKYTNTHIYDGYTSTDVDAHIYSETNSLTNSTSIKVEAMADGGDTNFAQVKFDGTDFKAIATSANNVPIDPVAAVYYTEVNTIENKFTSESVDVDSFTSNKFSGTEYVHEVGSKW